MNHKLNDPWRSFISFCRTMISSNQPNQLNPISMVSQENTPAYGLSIINTATKKRT